LGATYTFSFVQMASFSVTVSLWDIVMLIYVSTLCVYEE